MSRQGDTKGKILKLISEGSDNLSEISRKLNLAPSTVSKHIHDLESTNVIAQKSNPHVKKWKYYELNQAAGVEEFSGNGTNGGINGRNGLITKGNAIALATVACALLALFSFLQVHALQGASLTASVPISITDPPIVPDGTQALYVNYSSIRVHASYDGVADWISVNSSGRLELMSLINESQVIGEADIKPNSTIDRVEFNISSASITVDNVTYPVTVTRKQMAATVMGAGKVNGTSGVLLDFSPVVTPTYVQNETLFMMSPSLMAAMVPGGGPGQQAFGQPRPMQQQYRDLFNGSGANLRITNTTLTSAGNDTLLRITVKNDGKSNLTISGVMMFGDVMPYASFNAPVPIVSAPSGPNTDAAAFNCSEMMNGSMGPGRAMFPDGLGGFGAGRMAPDVGRVFKQANSSVAINSSAVVAMGKACGIDKIRIMLPIPANYIQISGIGNSSKQAVPQDGLNSRFMLMHPVGVGFSVGDNATLSLQLPGKIPEPAQWSPETGYVLTPGASVTLEYRGRLMVGRLGASETSPNDASYVVTVLTDNGVAQANFTS
jgi:DNA-binding transcriptional ArsR family regulator